ncbi:MAG: hypothetical protein Q9170_001617 [Blastenia crenularia]
MSAFSTFWNSFCSVQPPVAISLPPPDTATEVAWCIGDACITAFTISVHPEPDAVAIETTHYYHISPLIIRYIAILVLVVLLAMIILLKLLRRILQELRQLPSVVRRIRDWPFSYGATVWKKLVTWGKVFEKEAAEEVVVKKHVEDETDSSAEEDAGILEEDERSACKDEEDKLARGEDKTDAKPTLEEFLDPATTSVSGESHNEIRDHGNEEKKDLSSRTASTAGEAAYSAKGKDDQAPKAANEEPSLGSTQAVAIASLIHEQEPSSTLSPTSPSSPETPQYYDSNNKFSALAHRKSNLTSIDESGTNVKADHAQQAREIEHRMSLKLQNGEELTRTEKQRAAVKDMSPQQIQELREKELGGEKLARSEKRRLTQLKVGFRE